MNLISVIIFMYVHCKDDAISRYYAYQIRSMEELGMSIIHAPSTRRVARELFALSCACMTRWQNREKLQN